MKTRVLKAGLYKGLLAILFAWICIPVMGQPAPYDWVLGNPYTSKIDAAFPLNQNYVGVISGRNIHFEPMVRSFDILPTDAILNSNLFPAQYASTPIGDVISVNDTVALFFKGSVYVPVHKYTLAPLGNASTWTGLPGLWQGKIDAALEWSRGNYCFIKGLQYVLYDPFRRTYGSPQLLNRLPGWPPTWTGSIDAAFSGMDGYIYFLRKGYVLAYDANSLSPAPGEPSLLAGQSLNAVAVQSAEEREDLASNARKAGANPQGGPGVDPENPFAFDPDKEWCAVSKIEDYTNMKYRNVEQPSRVFGIQPGGKEFKDVMPSDARIAAIRMWGDGPIAAVQLVCVSTEGDITESDIHGSAWGEPEVFYLRQDECINQISGTYGGPAGNYIYTLQFVTNKRKSPVFGEFNGKRGTKSFEVKVNLEDAMSGLVGRADKYLHAIGMQYRSFSLLTIDADGKPVENYMNDELLNGTAADDLPKDPWFDKHKDWGPELDRLDLYAMPGYKFLLKTVDYTKIDPWLAISNKEDEPMTPFVVRISTALYGSKSDLKAPYGTRSGDAQISRGKSKEEISFFESFTSFSRSSDVTVAGGFEVPKVVSGSASMSKHQTNYSTIGSSSIIAYNEDVKNYGTSYVDLAWRDPETGKKNKQLLNFQFKEEVAALPPGENEGGFISQVPTSQMVKNGRLPGVLESYRKPYMDLIKKWGTHFMNNVTFGATYVKYSVISKQDATSGNISILDLKAGLKFGSATESEGQKTTKAGGEIEAGTTQSSSSSYSTSQGTMKTETWSVGGEGVSDYARWNEKAKDDPAPIGYTLYSLAEILNDTFFPFDKNIRKKQQILDIFIRQYIIDSNQYPDNPNRISPKWKPENGPSGEDSKIVTIKFTIKDLTATDKTDQCQQDGFLSDYDDNMDYYGNIKVNVTKENNSKSLGSAEIFSYTVSNPKEVNQNEKISFGTSKVITVNVPAYEVAKLRLRVSGILYDKDGCDSDDDDEEMNIDETAANPEVILVTSPGDEKTVTIPIGDNSFNMNVLVKYQE